MRFKIGMGLNWNLARVKRMILDQKDAQTIIKETGIKRSALRSIVGLMNMKGDGFYRIKGLFESDDTELEDFSMESSKRISQDE